MDRTAASPSNTSPAIYHGDNAAVMAAGVDSLYIGYLGVTSRAFLEAIANAGETLHWGTDRFDLSLGPRDFYNLTLNNERVNLEVATRNCPRDTPNVYVQLKAEAIHSIGLHQCRQNAVDLMESVFECGVEREIVSRVDLFADVSWLPGFKDVDSRKFVSRAKHRKINAYGSTVTGFEIGKGAMHARIYDKSRETQLKGKEWVATRWQTEKTTQIWRAEFQFRRRFLAPRGIDTFEDLLQHRQGLWIYATSEWLRMCSHSKGNQSRRPITKFWKLVQSARVDQGEGPVLTIPAMRRRGMKREDAVRQIAGVVKSHCRYLGVAEDSIVFGGMLPEIHLLLARGENQEGTQPERLQMPVEASALVN